MHFYEYGSIIVNIGIFLIGVFITFVGNYLTLSKDISYIKGQLNEILKCHEEVTTLVEKHAKLESDFSKTARDLDKLFMRIKVIETRIVNTANQGGLL